MRFPKRQRVGFGKRIAVFETQNRFFRQHRVDDLEARLIGREVLQRREAAFVFLVDENGVALREGSALAVLAGEADAEAFHQKRRERHVLGHRPVDALARIDHLAAALDQLADRLVDVEVVRDRGDAMPDVFQGIDRNARVAAPIIAIGAGDAGPASVEPVGLVGLVAVGETEFLVEVGADRRLHLGELGRGHHALIEEFFRIDVDDGRMRFDALVHRRLREHRLVRLVVTVTAIAEHVDDDGLLEALAELGRDLGDVDDGFRAVAVDVEDRRFDHQRDVGAIGR